MTVVVIIRDINVAFLVDSQAYRAVKFRHVGFTILITSRAAGDSRYLPLWTLFCVFGFHLTHKCFPAHQWPDL
jgi:hypothetical protein